jgi:hypothetical protein
VGRGGREVSGNRGRKTAYTTKRKEKKKARTYEGRGPETICPGLISKYVV